MIYDVSYLNSKLNVSHLYYNYTYLVNKNLNRNIILKYVYICGDSIVYIQISLISQ